MTGTPEIPPSLRDFKVAIGRNIITARREVSNANPDDEQECIAATAEWRARYADMFALIGQWGDEMLAQLPHDMDAVRREAVSGMISSRYADAYDFLFYSPFTYLAGLFFDVLTDERPEPAQQFLSLLSDFCKEQP